MYSSRSSRSSPIRCFRSSASVGLLIRGITEEVVSGGDLGSRCLRHGYRRPSVALLCGVGKLSLTTTTVHIGDKDIEMIIRVTGP